MKARGNRDREPDREIGRAMALILGELPVRERTALVRLYVLGENAVDICADLGMSLGEMEQAQRFARERFAQLARPAAGRA